MKRAEVWWADLAPPIGSRPVLILTRNAALPTIGGIVVALITRTDRGIPTQIELGRRQGLPTRCVASLDNLLTVPRQRLTRLMGALDSAKTKELNDALKIALEIP